MLIKENWKKLFSTKLEDMFYKRKHVGVFIYPFFEENKKKNENKNKKDQKKQ